MASFTVPLQRPLALELIDGDLNLPIHPGQQKFIIVWRQTTPIKFWFDTPVVDIGLGGVNHKIDLSIPSARWILAVGGPTLGPAVLLWGVLFVLILVAIVLGRVPLTPIKPLYWALLLMGLTQIYDYLVDRSWMVASLGLAI